MERVVEDDDVVLGWGRAVVERWEMERIRAPRRVAGGFMSPPQHPRRTCGAEARIAWRRRHRGGAIVPRPDLRPPGSKA